MNKKNNVNPFSEDILKTVSSRKKYQDVADAIGMPDEQDLETLRRIIQRYQVTHPGLLKHTINTARKEFEAGVYGNSLKWQGEAVVSKDSNMQYVFELPAGLYNAIEQVFPSMFKSKKHLHWFRQNFHKLTISEKEG